MSIARSSAGNRRVTYSVYGLTVAAPFAIPDLPVAHHPADVTIVEGAVPERLPERRRLSVLSEASPGNYLLRIPDVARFWVRHGTEVVVDAAPAVDASEIHPFLLGAVMTAVLHQRGALVLHGAAVAGADGAIVLAGHSGHGKSTLAATLAKQGYEVLSDDVAAVSADGADHVRVHGGPPRVDLWGDAMAWLGHEVSEARRTRLGVAKYSVRTAVKKAGPSRLKHVFVLDTHNGRGIQRTSLKDSGSFDAIREHTRNFRMLEGLGAQAGHLKLAALVASRVPMTQVRRPAGENSMYQLADVVGAVLG
jgi:energy-coupling factor transporter ATP-binding protein EcfA2